jgi:hypothetical protein
MKLQEWQRITNKKFRNWFWRNKFESAFVEQRINAV